MTHTAARRSAALLALAVGLALLGAPRPALANPPTLELITMGPGAEAFELFGHAALCVSSDAHPDGVCYNYGSADFSDPAGLGWSVLRGDAQFWVDPASRKRTVRAYIRQDRDVFSQRLPLSPEQATALAHALEENAKPENRAYRYDHFFNNCATPLRDLLDAHTGGKLREGADASSGDTFRDLIRAGFSAAPPVLYVQELALGRSIDREATVWETMFLPDHLRAEVAARLGAPAEVVYARQAPPPLQEPSGPMLAWQVGLVLTGLAFGALHLQGARSGRRGWLIPGSLVLGLVGLILWTLAILSPTNEVRWNEALLLFVPLDFALPFLGVEKRRAYAAGRVVVALGWAVAGAVGLAMQPLFVAALVPFLALAPFLVRTLGAAQTRQGEAPPGPPL